MPCCGWPARAEYGALEQRGLELALQLALAPLLADGLAQVELALFGPFALVEDDEVVRPGQLSRQWCDFSSS